MDVRRRTVAANMADAASSFVSSLDTGQRRLAVWPFPADEDRRRWFYTPTDHGGVAIGDLRPRQQQLAMRLVATGLSPAGYVTVCSIIGLENVLDELEGWPADGERERRRDPGLYYLRVFGDPSAEPTWAWRFGGHHVSLNHLVVDGVARASTPCFLGANPASSALLGPHPLRPLAGAEDLGRELVRSLDHDQRARAIVSPVAPADIITKNRSHVGDSLTGSPRGVPVTALDGRQRTLLRALLDVYLHRIPDACAEDEAAKIAGRELDRLSFAWAGSTTVGEPHYYRIQGPRLVVEYDNTQNGANHAHSVWRDPAGDFGADVLSEHYRIAH